MLKSNFNYNLEYFFIQFYSYSKYFENATFNNFFQLNYNKIIEISATLHKNRIVIILFIIIIHFNVTQ